MDILKNLFYGFPDLWGGGVAHSVLILALVITLGLSLGKLRVKGVSLGLAWILFISLIFGHFSLNLDEHLLHFLKEFGLILFVYSIGLEVGPGFFASFKNGGKSLNLLSIIVVALSIVTTLAIFSFSGTSITSMAGILSGAVTNTPGLGAAQQAFSDLRHIDAPSIAAGYAIAYPMGVLGVILSFIILRYALRINKSEEEAAAKAGNPKIILKSTTVNATAGQLPAWIDAVGSFQDDKDGYETLFKNLKASKYDVNARGDHAVTLTTTDSDGNVSDPVSVTVHVK